MRILFLTRYPLEGASSRYRVYQYVPHLRALGAEVTVSSFMNAAMYRLSFSPGRQVRKVIQTLFAIARRLAVLTRWRGYDVIYMQRELFPIGPPIVERWLKKRGAKLVFDLDDALFIAMPSRYNPIATWLRSPGKTYEIFAQSDLVMAGNGYLRDEARKYAPRAETFEVAEDTHRIQMRPPTTNEGGVTIGWLGSKTTVKYLELIEPALREVCARYPFVRIAIMGGGEFDLPGLPVEHLEWSLQGELEALASFDIGVMPLPMEDWSKGKSGGKARTYMAAGVPAVCSKIGYNIELIRDGETGYLAETHQDWVDKLSALIEAPDLRRRVGEAARADVMARFPVRGQAEVMLRLLGEVTAGKGGMTPAVVLGLSPTGLYAIRELARAGVPVTGVGPDRQTASRSRYLENCIIEPDETKRLERLMALGGEARPVLIPTSDQDIDFVVRHAETLSQRFAVQASYLGGPPRIFGKAGFYAACREHGIGTPRGWEARRSGLAGLAGEVVFPCLIKPSEIHAVKDYMAGRKVLIARGRAEFDAMVSGLPADDLIWLVQEIIPGPESEITLYCAHFGADGAPQQAFTARKLRQYPPGFGSASLVRSEDLPETRELAERLLTGIGYRGIAAVEFKRDPRDGKLKAIEANARPSLWFAAAAAAGKRVALAAYNELAGRPAPGDRAQTNGVQWRYLLKDLYARAFYWRRGDFILPPPALKALGAPKRRVMPVFDPADLRPSVDEMTNYASKLKRRMAPSGSERTMSGTFVISLDLELMWGVRDKRTVASWGDAVRGERRAIPEILRRFADAEVRATWAVVGMVFARDKDGILRHAPKLKPQYEDPRLSPYDALETEAGTHEDDDPHHFGRDFVEQIKAIPGQEVATHTFSHFYCLEPGQTIEAFEADLRAAIAIAAEDGLTLRSIVFPRNQMTDAHIAACRRMGIDCYRGNPETFAYRSRSGSENSRIVRATRLIDGVLSIDGPHAYQLEPVEDGPFNIPASRFLRPFNRRLPGYAELHLRRVMGEMTHAARSGRMYHLWWHPYNFGRDTDRNLEGLDQLLAHFQTLKREYGMESASMGDLAARNLSVVNPRA